MSRELMSIPMRVKRVPTMVFVDDPYEPKLGRRAPFRERAICNLTAYSAFTTTYNPVTEIPFEIHRWMGDWIAAVTENREWREPEPIVPLSHRGWSLDAFRKKCMIFELRPGTTINGIPAQILVDQGKINVSTYYTESGELTQHISYAYPQDSVDLIQRGISVAMDNFVKKRKH